MRVLALIFILIFVASSCSVEQILNKRGSSNVSEEQAGTSEDEDFEEGKEPTPITGRYLTYENGRVRGLFRKIKPKEYEIIWNATVTDGLGNEYEPSALATDTELSWGTPEAKSGKFEKISCSPSKDNLRLVCFVKLASENASISVNLELKKADKSRIENARVDLPYAVGIAAGLISTVPFQIVSEGESQSGLGLLDQGKKVGFQNLAFDSGHIEKSKAGAGCISKNRLFYSVRNYIYYLDLIDHKIRLYAGSYNVKNRENFTHRNRIFFDQSIGITCFENGLFVSVGGPGQILALNDDGSITPIAGKSTNSDNKFLIDEQILSPAAIYFEKEKQALYFYESGKSVFKKIDLNSQVITEIIPSETIPTAVSNLTMDKNKNLVFPIAHLRKVFSLNVDTGVMRTIAGSGEFSSDGDGGLATEASFRYPVSVAIGNNDTYYIADNLSHQIRKIDASTGKIATHFGTGLGQSMGDGGPLSEADLKSPTTLIFSEKFGLFFFENSQVIRLINNETVLETIAGSTESKISIDDQEASLARYKKPVAMAQQNDRSILMIDQNSFRIVEIDLMQKISRTILGNGSAPFIPPWSENPEPIPNLTQATDPIIPSKMIFANGSIYFSEAPLKIIRRFNLDTQANEVFYEGYMHIMANDNNQSIIFMDDQKIKKIDLISVDNDKKVYTLTGGESGFAGDGGPAIDAKLQGISDFSVDKNRNIYVADSYNRRIRKLIYKPDNAYTIETFAGNGTIQEVSPDGSEASDSSLGIVSKVAAGPSGRIYFINDKKLRYFEKKKDGIYRLETLIGGSEAGVDCATGSISGTTHQSDIKSTLRASLGNLCFGQLTELLVTGRCDEGNSEESIFVSQDIANEGNIIQISLPCEL